MKGCGESLYGVLCVVDVEWRGQKILASREKKNVVVSVDYMVTVGYKVDL